VAAPRGTGGPTGAQWRRASAIFLGVGLLHALFGLLLVLALNS
jgi:hypothetical protein